VPAGFCPNAPLVGVTLVDTLRVASLANLDIAIARQLVNQAAAVRQRAQVLALPNLSIGSNYIYHTGRIQKTEGNIINMDRDSLFVGGGPSVSFSLSDALFSPAVTRQVLAATQAGERRVTNDTLLAVADVYFAVLRARRRVARIDETLEFLSSPQRLALRGDAPGLLPLITAFLETGAALPLDQARVEVEILRRREERVAALQDLRVAIAELARLLHQDPTVVLWPLEDFRVPVAQPGADWCGRDVVELVAQALNNRPELAEQQALVEAALARVRTARWRPLLPNAIVSYNYGGYGGGPPLVTRDGKTVFALSGQIADFGSRSDFDATLVWRLENLGLGNLAQVREQTALHRQAVLNKLRLADVVVTQVVQAHEQVQRTGERVRITRDALYDPSGSPTGIAFRSLRLNFTRIKGGEGRPLEALDSVRGLNDSIEAYVQAVTDFERARFRLLVALGMPAQALLDPQHCMPALSTQHSAVSNQGETRRPRLPRLATDG
jgi:outer membrane protein TolC